MYTVMLMCTPHFYLDPLPTRCYHKDRPYEASTAEEADGFRQELTRQFPDCTYAVKPVSSVQESEVISLTARTA